ncbi:phosphotransferase [uncultured Clostridium sp.]|uniref:phosphotransferase n=1 Tax=uncultured Clostridium sp. TaxID=59620 RepID=UPI00260757E4|nr:phosphotransferase [uncultured Clostridium sp.]
MINSLQSFLQTKYKNISLKPLLGGYTNEVFLLKNPTLSLVVKVSQLSNVDSCTEYICLNLLTHFKWIPKIKENFKFKENNVLIMDYIDGINGQTYLGNNNIHTSEKIYKLLGEHLAQVHSINLLDSSVSLPSFKLSDIDITKLKCLPSKSFNEVQQFLSIYEEDNYVLTHGDFGCHNSILTDDSLYIIDWEWAGLGNPLLDISWVVWLFKFHYPNFSNILPQIFIQSYRENSPQTIDLSKIKSYALFKIISIINKIPISNSISFNEWIKRLHWTLKTDFCFTN